MLDEKTVKRKELEKKMKKLGWYLQRHGSSHDIWPNGDDQIEIPRHAEINEKLARYGILRLAKKSPGKKKSRT